MSSWRLSDRLLSDIFFCFFLAGLSLLCSGVSRSGPSGGGVSFPEAAHMPVSPSSVYLCSGQHSSRSPGGDQTQASRRAAEGESLSQYALRCPCCVLVPLSGGQLSPNQSVCCCRWSTRCATRQQRRSPFRFCFTREFQMCCCFLSMARGMRGMLERCQPNPNLLCGARA